MKRDIVTNRIDVRVWVISLIKIKTNFSSFIQYEGIINRFSTSTLVSLENTPRQMLELDIIVPENYVLPLENHLVYVPGSATADVYVSGNLTRKVFFFDR